MSQFNKKSLKNLSQEELIELVLSLNEQNNNSKNEIQELKQVKEDYIVLEKSFDELKRDFEEMQIAYNKLLKENEKKNFTIKKINHEKFCSKAENLNKTNIIINEAESEKSKGKPGRPKGSKNFEKLDLESLVTEVIFNEPKTKICENCGNFLVKFDEDVTYKIKRIPPKFEVIKVITPVYKCKNCHKIVQATSEKMDFHFTLIM